MGVQKFSVMDPTASSQIQYGKRTILILFLQLDQGQDLLQKKLTDNEDLKEFNYEKILNQRLFTPSEIASVIHENYLEENLGWSNLISNVYDYYEG